MWLTLLERLAARRRRPGSHPAWTAVAMAAFLVRLHQKRAAKDAVALREVLRPGETLVISHTTQRRG
jgi:hypothetical protein